MLHGQDVGEIASLIKTADLKYVMAAMLCVVVFLLSESLNTWLLFMDVGYRFSFWKAWLYSTAGFFFAYSTPFGVAAMPAQLIYMRKDKIPSSVATSVLIFKSITYKGVLSVSGIFLLLFRFNQIRDTLGGSVYLFYLGVSLVTGYVLFFSVAFLNTEFLKNLCGKVIFLLGKIRIIKDPENFDARSRRFLDSYKAGFLAMGTNIWRVLKSFAISAVQRFAYVLVTWFIYLSLGLSGDSCLKISALQLIIYITVDLLPLPGGSGIYELLFSIIFINIFVGDTLVPGLLLSRGVAYYTQLAICLIMVIIMNAVMRRQTKINIDNEEDLP